MQLSTKRTRWRMSDEMRWLPVVLVSLWILHTVDSLTGSNVCMEKQKYNVTKRIKYRAPMAVRTYEWCLAVPPRCSRWTTEMKDLTRLETEERTMEMAVCCPGFVTKAGICHPKCPSGQMGRNCSEKCPKNKWGPSCSKDCESCPEHSSCSPYTGNCVCDARWKGERCEQSMDAPTTISIPSTVPTTSTVAISTAQTTLLTAAPSTESATPTTTLVESTTNSLTTETSTVTTTSQNATTTVTVDNIESTRQLPPVSQNTDRTMTENIIRLRNITKTYKHELEMNVAETATPKMTQWTVTETPATSTIINKLTSESITVRTSLKEVITTTKQQAIISTTPTPLTTKETTTKLMKYVPTTVPNVNPKEIWIIPTQKGDSSLIESKNKSMTDSHKNRNINKTQQISDKTTPRTIIVSIIPTSIDHTAVFKKITLASSENKPSKNVHAFKNNTRTSSLWKIITVTKPSVKILPSTEHHIKRNILTTTSNKLPNSLPTLPGTVNSLLLRNISKYFNAISTTIKPKTVARNSSQNIRYYNIYTTSPNSINSSITSKPITTMLNTIPSRLSLSLVTPATPSFNKVYLSTKSTVKFNSSSISTTSYVPMGIRAWTSSINSTSKVLRSNITTTTRFLPTSSTTRRPTPSITSTTTRLLPTSSTTRRPNPSITSTSVKPTDLDASILNHLVTIQRNETSTAFEEIGTSKPAKSTRKPNISADTIARILASSPKKHSPDAVTKLTSTNHNLATNQALTNTITPTESIDRDEVFDVLTEPEHITAVVEGGTDRNTDNLLSVLSIVGGVMFAVITVAVVIVMMERCRRSRYENLVKIDSARMRAMEGEHDPPPYVRSIFHTPLPEPPISEKEHYQPISTLDRNLKQFMRPVAVHSISPIMMENFRGILECHYDHLPPRSSHVSFRSDTLSCQFRSSTAPSIESQSELCCQRSPISVKKLPVTDSSVETLKHEVAIDYIDATAEPLYAEIPCWRVASQHAIEVVNLNGEAVTEL